jgi:hypothetical protein
MFDKEIMKRRKTVADLKIMIYESGAIKPNTTITIPGSVIKVASRLIPRRAASALQEKGIDLNEIVKLSENPDVRGTLVEIEEHDTNERIVIALE